MATAGDRGLEPDELDIDTLLDDFHRAWNSRKRPSIRSFLDSHSGTAATDPEFVLAVLSIDLEHRLDANDQPPLVEDYLGLAEKYSLSADHLLRLAQQEYHGRWKRGEIFANRDDYRRRFPAYATDIDRWRPHWSCPSCPRENIPLADESSRQATCPRCRATFDVRHLFAPPPVPHLWDFECSKVLGIGGMGEVFESRDPTLDRILAIKVIRRMYSGDRAFERRFLREARITGRLQHPAIVPVHGVGRLPDGRLFYSMKLVQGRTLASWLHDPAPAATPGESAPDLITVFSQICDAIAYAHDNGVVHRDLKPANVMVGRFSEVQVMDWGLAKEVDGPIGDPDVVGDESLNARDDGSTSPGKRFGTILYMPPEQARGETDRIGKASDVFSLGALLCEILTGLPPYQKPGEGWPPEDRPGRAEREPPDPAVFRIWLQRAEAGDTSPGMERLSAGAPEHVQAGTTADGRSFLVQLARDCLAKDQAERPQDAVAVAQRMGMYREVIDRLAQEKIAADAREFESKKRLEAEVKARTRAEEAAAAARRAKRRLQIIAGLVGLLFAIAGGATFIVRDEAARRKLAEISAKNETIRRQTQEAVARDMTRLKGIAEEQRGIAASQRDIAKKSSYAANMSIAGVAWREGRVQRALDLLNRQSPERGGEPDLRGFEWPCLLRMTRQNHLTLWGHRSAIAAVAFSPDGQCLASVGVDGQLKVWNLKTGFEALSLVVPSARATRSVAYSPDGGRVAACGDDGMIRIRDARSGDMKLSFELSRRPLGCLTYSPDGKWIAAAEASPDVPVRKAPFEVRICDASTGKEVRNLRGHTQGINAVSFSADSKRLVTASDDHSVIVWDASTGDVVSTYYKHHTAVMNAVFLNQDGSRVASSGLEDTVRLWKVDGAETLSTLPVQDTVLGMAVHLETQRLLTGGNRAVVQLWDARTGSELQAFKGHTGTISGVAFNTDGSRLASAGFDKTIRVWSASGWQGASSRWTHRANVSGVAFSPHDDSVVSVDEEGIVTLSDVQTGETRSTFRSLPGALDMALSHDGKSLALCAGSVVAVYHTANGHLAHRLAGHRDQVFGLAFSNDDKILFSASADRTVRVWNTSNGELVRTLAGHRDYVKHVAIDSVGRLVASGGDDFRVVLRDAKTWETRFSLAGHPAAISRVGFNAEGTRLAAACLDGSIRVWDTSTGNLVQAMQSNTSGIMSLAFSPDGRRLAVGNIDRSVTLWDPSIGQEAFTLSDLPGVAFRLAFDRDGRRLAVGSGDTVMVWEAPPEVDLRLPGHREVVWKLAFSRDGKSLASASGDRTVKLWDATTGRELRTITGHGNHVRSVVLSPDGKLLASAGYDRIVKIWDTSNGRELVSCIGHDDAVTSVAFHPDGRRISSGSLDGTVKVWDVKTGEKIRTLKGSGGHVLSVAYHPQGNLLAAGSSDRGVHLWDAESGEHESLPGHENWVVDIAFLDGGKRLASASTDGTIRVRDFRDGRVQILHESAPVTAIAVSSDSRWLASVCLLRQGDAKSPLSQIKLWNVASRDAEGRAFPMVPGQLNALAFSPDGKRLAVAGSDHPMRILGLSQMLANPLSAVSGR